MNSVSERDGHLNLWQVWWLAARPKTLPAAAAPVIVGTAVAISNGKFQFLPALAALLAALLLQIGANFANDVGDFQKGADTLERQGPLRVTQAGLLKPEQVVRGMWVVFGLAALVGVYLVVVAGWPVILIGVFSILAAVAYTAGPFPLGYYGLGEVFVFLFFGLAAVAGTYFVQAGEVTALALWASVPMGLLTVNILVVNNLRDIETDRAAGKKTLAVRFGVDGARLEYLICLLGAFSIPPMLWLVGLASPWTLIAWLSLPLAQPLVGAIYHEKGSALNQTLVSTGRFELVFGLLFSLGLILGSL
jgi:1,4-dihydroxy-2-naphthoate octaprenyltransferase